MSTNFGQQKGLGGVEERADFYREPGQQGGCRAGTATEDAMLDVFCIIQP